jgi:hypothetical protein
VSDALRSPGDALDPGLRADLEPRLGHHFGRVRVHAGAEAQRSAAALNARAYTVGTDVVFGAGEYAPRSAGGRDLIAHELAHVVQQSSGASTPVVQRKIQSLHPPLDSFFKKAGVKPRLSDGVYSLRGKSGGTGELEIVSDLLGSQRLFTVDGMTETEAVGNLKAHVAARKGIVALANKPRKLYGFAAGVKDSRVNRDLWTLEGGRLAPKEGVTKLKASEDLQKTPGYMIACEAAADMTMTAGSNGSPITEEDFLGPNDWVPGDWGFIENTKRDRTIVDDAHAGQNIIYVGGKKFWGHVSAQQTYKTLAEWIANVNAYGKAKVSSAVKYPKRGLI